MKIRMPGGTWADVGTAGNPLNVRTPQGTWLAFGEGGGQPLLLRDPNGNWIQVSTEGVGQFFIMYFSALDRNLGYNKFIESTGWEIQRRFFYEYKREPDIDASGGRVLGEQIVTSVGGIFRSEATSGMGWIGDENNTFYRFNIRDIAWFSLPLGMFIAAAQVTRYLYQTQQPGSWADTAEHAGTEVDYRLSGYSLIKSQLPGMNSYNLGTTTTGVGPGVGQLLRQGPTPDTYKININYTHSDSGVLNPTPLFTTTEPYTLPVIRNRGYTIEDGDSLWTGDLNTLGMQNGIHGLPYTPEYTLTETFTTANYGPEDSISYHVRVSPLADPPPIDFTRYYATANYMNVMFNVRVKYRYQP